MKIASAPQRYAAFDSMSSADVQALLAGAGSLAAAGGAVLRNRHVAVLCEPGADESPATAWVGATATSPNSTPASTSATTVSATATSLSNAAAALGAMVVRLKPDALALEERLSETARLLGRLYCLICSEGLAPSVNAGLSRWSGVPLLCDLAQSTHPSRILADLLVMLDQARRPAAKITLGLGPGIDAKSAQAWRSASALTGLHIVRFDAAAAAPPGCDFWLGRPLSSNAGAGPPRLEIACAGPRVAATAGVGLAALQTDAHHRLLCSLMALVSR